MHVFGTLAKLLAVGLVSAHDANVAREIAARLSYSKLNKMDLSHCLEGLKNNGRFERSARRRAEIVSRVLNKRGIRGEARHRYSINSLVGSK